MKSEPRTLRDAIDRGSEEWATSDRKTRRRHDVEEFIEASVSAWFRRNLTPTEPRLPSDLCLCGHRREQHIYWEGACRPGFTCAQVCKQFVREAP